MMHHPRKPWQQTTSIVIAIATAVAASCSQHTASVVRVEESTGEATNTTALTVGDSASAGVSDEYKVQVFFSATGKPVRSAG